jgi:hypothetical protein
MADMLCGAKLSLYTWRGNVKVIKSLNRITLVKDRIDGAMHLFAILNINATLLIDGDLKVIVCTDLLVCDVPDIVTKLGDGR